MNTTGDVQYVSSPANESGVASPLANEVDLKRSVKRHETQSAHGDHRSRGKPTVHSVVLLQFAPVYRFAERTQMTGSNVSAPSTALASGWHSVSGGITITQRV